MNIAVTILIAVLGSNGLFSVIMLVIQRHYSKKDREDDASRKIVDDMERLTKAVEVISHDAYFKDCRALMKKDAITEEELENHEFLYKEYHSLGLNGTGDRMHQIILEKPMKTSVE